MTGRSSVLYFSFNFSPARALSPGGLRQKLQVPDFYEPHLSGRRHERYREGKCPTMLRSFNGGESANKGRRFFPAEETMSATENPLPGLSLLRVRDETVLLDSDLAALYGVETKVFNQAMRRHARRFPKDFAFQLSDEEWIALRSQTVTLKPGARGQHRKYLPWAFTEHGAIMAATILNSERAVAMSTYVVRAFVRLRRELLTTTALELRLTKIEKDLLSHDAALRSLYTKIKPLLLPPPEPPEKEMGYHTHLKKS